MGDAGSGVGIRPFGPDDQPGVARLWSLYAAEFRESLGPQDLEREGRRIPLDYRLPDAAMWVAVQEGTVVGCAAWKRFDGSSCELKRMVVDSALRGQGVGRRLAQAVLHDIAWRGFVRVLLDTTPEMVAAQELYRRLGFREVPAYHAGPLRHPVFMALDVSAAPLRDH